MQTTPLPTTTRLAYTKIALVAGIGGAMLVGMIVMGLWQQHTKTTALPPPPLPPLYEVQGDADLLQHLQLKKDWAGVDRTPPKPAAPVPPPPPPQQPMFVSREPVALPPLQPVLPVTTIPPVVAATPKADPAKTEPVHAQTPTPPPKNRPSRWLFATTDQGKIGKPPFPLPTKGPGAEAPKDPTNGLIHPATWARPVDATQVLYRSQAIHGTLLVNVNSDIPGDVKIYVTRAVTDRFAQGHVLIPQHALIIGTQEGKVNYGQSRLGVTLDQIEFPDGTIVALKAKVADKSGAVGAVGSVNNHYGRLVLSAGLSALLSIGARAPFGSSEHDQPTLQQDFARDVSRSLNQSGQAIVQRELNVAPTITIPAGTEVSLQVQENVSFTTAPTLVK